MQSFLKSLVFITAILPGLAHAADKEYLFVINAQSGTLKETRLTLKDISGVTYFSERPDRISGQTTTKEFVKLWRVGSDNFDKDHPNAVLAVLGNNTVVELKKIHKITSDSLVFDVKILSKGQGVAGDFGAASLFIDAFPTAVNSQITD